MTKYYVDAQGNYLGGFDGAEPPQGAIEVPSAPNHGDDKWVNGEWVEIETPEQTTKRLELVLDNYLDEVAKSYGYESIKTMVTYPTSTNPKFAAEGQAAIEFRDAVYTKGIELIADVQADKISIPTESELLALMPKFTDFLTQ